MAEDKKSILKGGLRPRKQADTVRLPARDVEAIEKVAENVHQRKESEQRPAVTPIKRTSIDFPLPYYTAIKQESFKRGITFKDYILELVQKELNLEDF